MLEIVCSLVSIYRENIVRIIFNDIENNIHFVIIETVITILIIERIIFCNGYLF